MTSGSLGVVLAVMVGKMMGELGERIGKKLSECHLTRTVPRCINRNLAWSGDRASS